MPNRSECEAVVRQLWPYLDGAVPDRLRERIVIHLEQCTHCTSHFEFARAFLDAVAASRPHMAADARLQSLQSRVLLALASEGFTAM